MPAVAADRSSSGNDMGVRLTPGAAAGPDDGTRPRWEHFPHGADVGVRGWGRSREEAFEQAALALTAVVTDPARVAERKRVEIACEAQDGELLLAEWLNALVYEMATRGMLFRRFRVKIAGGAINGEAWGETVEVARHEPAAEVKGATLTELKVGRSEEGHWFAQCVLDV